MTTTGLPGTTFSTDLSEIFSREGRELSTHLPPVSTFTGKGSPVSLPSQVRGESLVKGHLFRESSFEPFFSPDLKDEAPFPQALPRR